MKVIYDPHKHHRRSIRLIGYDYSLAGAYFVTICTRHMNCRFGYIEDDKMIVNDAGKMIDEQWQALAERFPQIELDEFITMPNHFHAILIITNETHVGAPLVGAQDVGAQTFATHERGQAQGQPLRVALGDMIGAFKSITGVWRK